MSIILLRHTKRIKPWLSEAAAELNMSLQNFHPVIAEWFSKRFANPTEPQALGWPTIRERRDTLIAAPTGSGKTLTAFLASLDRLLRLALAGELRDQTYV